MDTNGKEKIFYTKEFFSKRDKDASQTLPPHESVAVPTSAAAETSEEVAAPVPEKIQEPPKDRPQRPYRNFVPKARFETRHLVGGAVFLAFWGALMFAWVEQVNALVNHQLREIAPPDHVLSFAAGAQGAAGNGTATSTDPAVGVMGGNGAATSTSSGDPSSGQNDPVAQDPNAPKRTTATIAPDAGSYEFEVYYNEASDEHRIKVFRKGNMVPLQILKISVYGGDVDGKVRVTDLNFDGYKDVLGLIDVDEFKNRTYGYAFFDRNLGTFACNRVISSCEFTNPSVFSDLQEVVEDISCGDEGYCKRVNTYQLYKGALTLTRIEEYERDSEDLYCLRVTDISPDTKKKTSSRECTGI